MSTGDTLQNHREAPPSYLPDGDPGRFGGGTYTSNNVEPTLEAYENIFGPSARDIKQDLQRFKRHGRWHLPDILKGPNQYLTDRVDGLITDAASSPFTSRILPYKYITNVDGKIKWNVWSFDEGLASRVPYESAARTLTQSKRSFAGYFIRQGMAIVLEHNFMMTEAGRENFRRQLNQLVGSIQLTNDLDVHVALVLAPSYQKTMNEKYLTQDKSAAQICREFVEMFGFVQKNQNALDILIEEAKGQLKTWGAPMPDFMLCNSKLTFQLTMIPDVTNYVTKGPEGAKKLKTGPELSSYRGIGIVHTRAFSMETGAPPRDMLRRRVRVAEYYRILPHKDNHKRNFQLYNEERDTWSTFTFQDLLHKALCNSAGTALGPGPGRANNDKIQRALHSLSAPAAAANHIGEAMAGDHVDGTIKGSLTECYAQLMMEKAALKDFTWEPFFLNDKLVFVPGAMDLKSHGAFVNQINITDVIKELPDYIKYGAQKLNQHYQSTGVGMPIDISNRLKIVVQSVAPYHRNMLVTQFKADVDTLLRINDYLWPSSSMGDSSKKAFDDYRAAKTAGLPVQKIFSKYILYSKLLIRNYLRFGIPNLLLGKPGISWGDNVTMNQAFKMNADLTTINYFDQSLRNLGAWFCPNHFLDGSKRQFENLGDHVGYHMLITEELSMACNLKKDAYADIKDKNSVHMGSYIYEAVMKPDEHKDLYDDVHKLLVAVNNDAAMMGKVLSRAEISKDFVVNLRVAIDARAAATHKEKDAFRRHDVYWYMPRTTNSKDEVWIPAARTTSKWKRDLWNLNSFKDYNTINEAVLKDIHAAGAGFDSSSDSINSKIVMPAKFPSVHASSARNLLCMLAWRLYADQEVSLDAVYNSNQETWPANPDNFLFPQQTHFPLQFGQGIMNFGDPSLLAPPGTNPQELRASRDTQDIEIVIVRPNIEHYMMGIILGQGGESLGSTFWGQTELSCYDDSMHGIWGMSYKYHERAIVINERNLIRLWDVAYDGYVGGKDDTSVAWDDHDETHPHSRASFMQATTDVTRPYRGPSMMVMAFHHLESKNAVGDGGSVFKNNFSPNWPSPIVFYDRLEEGGQMSARADFDNLHAVDVGPFRVFNNDVYRNAYRPYKEKMPDFYELHTIRKNAGLAATENEVSSDALAFQGTMRVVSAESGAVIQETLGSGHHGPDFIGVASLRAGKGYRLNSQPTVHRLV